MNTRTVVILFTDLVESTKRLTGLGPAGPEAIAIGHLGHLQRLVEQFGGTVVKTTGDGVMASFPSASGAIDAAVGIQQAIDSEPPEAPVGGRVVRIGISAGDAGTVDDDWAGTCIVEAKRLCDATDGGHILAAGLVVSLAGVMLRQEVKPAGEMMLAGLPSATSAYEVMWTPLAARPLSVVLADDSVLVRQGIAALLTREGFRVAGQADEPQELLRLVDAYRPDLAVVDIRMPPTYTLEGIHAAETLKTKYPDMGVMILSSHLESPAAVRLFSRLKGIGYLHKDRAGDGKQFASDLRRVLSGEPAIDQEVVKGLMDRRRPNDPMDRLSRRESEVVEQMAQGLSNQAISDRLVLSLRTVEDHVRAIFEKLGLEQEADIHRRVVAVLAFWQRS